MNPPIVWLGFLSLSPHSKPSSLLFHRADSRSLLRGNKEDPLKVVKEGTVKSTVERMNALAKQMARKLIIHHVDDNVVAKVKSSASSSRTRPPPHFKSQLVNAPPPQSKRTELLDTTLQDVFQFISPTEADFLMRIAIITQLRDVLKSVKSLRDVTVEPYGSFVSNLYTRWSNNLDNRTGKFDNRDIHVAPSCMIIQSHLIMLTCT
ncbi:Uncharacterized protein Rs2_18761 [Raphanus sativus]|nr:Uncharacterized protein Rs2_18761 [Raphanus sativus]